MNIKITGQLDPGPWCQFVDNYLGQKSRKTYNWEPLLKKELERIGFFPVYYNITLS
ncbi:MAG: hypothetical protein ACXWC7_11695 [Chitinophagaceae bacterium]